MEKPVQVYQATICQEKNPSVLVFLAFYIPFFPPYLWMESQYAQ